MLWYNLQYFSQKPPPTIMPSIYLGSSWNLFQYKEGKAAMTLWHLRPVEGGSIPWTGGLCYRIFLICDLTNIQHYK